jgi:hypothetical protein
LFGRRKCVGKSQKRYPEAEAALKKAGWRYQQRRNVVEDLSADYKAVLGPPLVPEPGSITLLVLSAVLSELPFRGLCRGAEETIAKTLHLFAALQLLPSPPVLLE